LCIVGDFFHIRHEMKFTLLSTAALLLFSSNVIAHPQPISNEISLRDAEQRDTSDALEDVKELFKRKGGGGGGGKGGGGGSSGGSGKGGSGGSGSSGGTGSTGRGSPGSNVGGATKTGSGPQPNYGGGRYYGGGATSPYASGARSPLGIAPIFLGVGLLSLYPGLWLYGAYNYPYNHPYTFYNRTATNSSDSATQTRDIDEEVMMMIRQAAEGFNQTKPVTCLCAAYAECGCDDNGNTTFLDNLIGDGTYSNLNLSIVNVADINGTSTIILNGTLPNGTSISGGTDDAITGDAVKMLANAAGYWVMVALVGATVYLV